jgi:transcriptional regulator with XRE-family HTH domain
MPERSFGQTIRYRRTKLGLSQTKLGELVGRSASTIRAWERDKTAPNDTSVVVTLSAVLGITERVLFDKLGMTPPESETNATVEEVLAELAPEPEEAEETAISPPAEDREPVEPTPASEPLPPSDSAVEPTPAAEPPPPTDSPAEPAFAPTAEPYRVTTPVVPAVEPSYIEDQGQRQLYRVRYLATAVALVALGIALLWALDRGLEAFAEWWDVFFGNLRF